MVEKFQRCLDVKITGNSVLGFLGTLCQCWLTCITNDRFLGHDQEKWSVTTFCHFPQWQNWVFVSGAMQSLKYSSSGFSQRKVTDPWAGSFPDSSTQWGRIWITPLVVIKIYRNISGKVCVCVCVYAHTLMWRWGRAPEVVLMWSVLINSRAFAGRKVEI